MLYSQDICDWAVFMKTYSLLIYLCDILQMPTNVTRRPVHSCLINADLEHGFYLCLKRWSFHYYYWNSRNYKMIKTLKHISGHGKQLSTNKHIFNFVETLKKQNSSFSTTQSLLVFKDTSVCFRQLKHEKPALWYLWSFFTRCSLLWQKHSHPTAEP